MPMESLRRVTPVHTKTGWREEPRYVCKRCGGIALLHPDTNQVWGCQRCSFFTASVSIYFREATAREQGKGEEIASRLREAFP